MSKYKISGFFSGTGGIELGFEQAGFETVYSNEWDKFASKTYAQNFNTEHLAVEDINKVDFKSMPDTNVIMGGFPCQAFSIAGYRKGFQDEAGRGNLFFKIAEAIEEKQPEVVFLENVKNLVGHDKGKTFKVILATLKKLGYHTRYQVLNAKDYGNTPQGRERIYIVAFKDAEAAERFQFPEKVKLTTKIKDLVDFKNKVEEKYYYTAAKYPKIYKQLAAEINEEGAIYQWRRQYVRKNMSGVCPTLTANMGTGGHNVPLVFTKHGIRKLTPRECFNIMGYPKTFKLPELSDAQLYKQAGNAVVVPVIKRIADNINLALKG